LAIFNLIPIHPLDGGKILVGFLPDEESVKLDEFLRHYGMLILFFLIFPTFGGNSAISLIISPIINFFLNILIPGSTLI
jgi:Zn-dependent protease